MQNLRYCSWLQCRGDRQLLLVLWRPSVKRDGAERPHAFFFSKDLKGIVGFTLTTLVSSCSHPNRKVKVSIKAQFGCRGPGYGVCEVGVAV